MFKSADMVHKRPFVDGQLKTLMCKVDDRKARWIENDKYLKHEMIIEHLK